MKRVALIVGINRYPFIKNDKGECLDLTTPARDASAIAYRLERDGNFEVTRYPSKDPWEIDPKPRWPVNLEALKNEITRLFQPKGNVPDTALLFFSGSGFRLNNQDGSTEGFLGTSDVNPRKNRWGVCLKWLHTVLQNSPIQQQIIWLDCSYSGEFLKSTKSTEIPAPNKKRAQCFIVATQDDQPSYAVNQQGLLTQWILKNSDPAKQANGIVTTKTLAESFPSQFKVDDITQNPICLNIGDPIILTSIGDIHFHQQSEHRLQRLWRETESWFSNDNDNTLMKHDYQTVSKYFSQNHPDPDQSRLYREEVEKALGGTPLPDSWWQEESIWSLHESLKSLCGDFFSGSDKNSACARHISVGAAYLIAIVAYQEIFPNNLTPLTDKVTNWNERSRASTSWLFPPQDSQTARSSALALYDLFYSLFYPSKPNSQTIATFFDPPGNILKIQFGWAANQPAERGGESLAEWTSNLLKTGEIFIPQQAGNTRNAILRLLGSMLVSKKGFLSPGVVYMENQVLVVSSTK